MVLLTKLKPEAMGAHSLSVAYGVNSLVMSGDGAAAYISVKDVPAGTPLNNTDYWRPHTDLTAVRQSAEAAAQKANAARDEMLEIARNLTDAVAKSGNPVRAELVGGLPFDRVATALSPMQAGSGDPSPTNIRKISGWTGAALMRCGKNLFDTSKLSLATCRASGNDSELVLEQFGNYGTATLTVDVKPNTNYTLSFKLKALYENNSFAYKLATALDASAGYTTVTQAGPIAKTINTGNNDKIYIHIRPTNASGVVGTVTLYYLMLEESSSATEYEPYTGDTYAADFGQTVYGGTLDWQTGALAVDFALSELDGSDDEKWAVYTYSNGKQSFFTQSDVISGIVSTGDARIPGICSYAPTQDGYLSGIQRTDVNNYRVEIKNDVIANWGITPGDLTAFKAMLAANPLQIAYKLATPTTIRLTPQEIRQLQGANTLYGDGNISIVGRANPALVLDARIAALEAAAPAE